jgi:hypothetical protein
MRKEKAKQHFLGQKGHVKLNCAQAVIKAYHDVFSASQQDVDSFAAYGAGRAPGGSCGAYYAAQYLILKKDPQQGVILEREFSSAAGSLKCKDIRSLRKLTCLGCVEKAAELLEGGR